MERKKAEEVLQEVSEKYQENPRGWSFWVSRESDPPEMYLIHGDTAYFLKVDSLYTPNLIGVGAKFKIEEDQLPENLPEYGFRPLSREELKKMFEGLPFQEIESEEELQKTATEIQKRARGKLKEKKPTALPTKEGQEFGLLGPHMKGKPLEYVSDKQREISKDLEEKLEKLKKKRYPAYA